MVSMSSMVSLGMAMLFIFKSSRPSVDAVAPPVAPSCGKSTAWPGDTPYKGMHGTLWLYSKNGVTH